MRHPETGFAQITGNVLERDFWLGGQQLPAVQGQFFSSAVQFCTMLSGVGVSSAVKLLNRKCFPSRKTSKLSL